MVAGTAKTVDERSNDRFCLFADLGFCPGDYKSIFMKTQGYDVFGQYYYH